MPYTLIFFFEFPCNVSSFFGVESQTKSQKIKKKIAKYQMGASISDFLITASTLNGILPTQNEFSSVMTKLTL